MGGAATFDEIDNDGDGVITREEFAAYEASRRTPSVPVPPYFDPRRASAMSQHTFGAALPRASATSHQTFGARTPRNMDIASQRSSFAMPAWTACQPRFDGGPAFVSPQLVQPWGERNASPLAGSNGP